PALAASLSVLALLIWYVLIISANAMGGGSPIAGWPPCLRSLSYDQLALAVVGVTTLVVMSFFESRTRKQERQKGEPYYGWLYWCATILSAGLAVTVEYFLLPNDALRDLRYWGYFDKMPGFRPDFRAIHFFAPAISWLAAMLVLVVLRVIASHPIVDPR